MSDRGSGLRPQDHELWEFRPPTYDRTPVDCLISELRDLFGMNGRAYLTKGDFEARVSQFREEVALRCDACGSTADVRDRGWHDNGHSMLTCAGCGVPGPWSE